MYPLALQPGLSQKESLVYVASIRAWHARLSRDFMWWAFVFSLCQSMFYGVINVIRSGRDGLHKIESVCVCVFVGVGVSERERECCQCFVRFGDILRFVSVFIVLSFCLQRPCHGWTHTLTSCRSIYYKAGSVFITHSPRHWTCGRGRKVCVCLSVLPGTLLEL